MLKQNEVPEELFGDKKIIQNELLYRFTSDSILLSRFARCKAGDAVADFCSGSGIVGFHFMCINPGLVKSLTLFEMQEELADMSRRTAEMNGFDCEVVCARIQDIPKSYDGKFSLILCNPPYERAGFENTDFKKAVCRKEITVTLKEIAEVAKRKLKFGGRLAVVSRADRAAELIFLLKSNNLEPKRLQFASGSQNGKPYLVMAEAVKGGKEGVEVLPVIVNRAESAK